MISRRFTRLALGFYRNSTEKQMQQALTKYYKRNQPLSGYCTEQQSLNFTKIDTQVDPSHWRQPLYIKQKLKISSLGIGTQNGAPDSQTDLKMFTTLVRALKSGQINHIDTDINFRYGKSQKTINSTLHYLHHEHRIPRSSFFLATKCGYIPNDIDSNLDQKAFTKLMLQEGYITRDDIVNEVHCMHPSFIQFCTEKSLLSLGVQTLDLMYLNNPTEAQQTVIGKEEYFGRLEKAFDCLEKLRLNNKIRYYGIASFVSFRSPPDQHGIHADLNQIVKIAKKIGGDFHGLRFVLVPFNLGMPEVLMKWQISQAKTEEHIFAIAQQNKVNVNLCCPLFQGRVANLPFKSEYLGRIMNNSAKHLQFLRSTPRDCVLSTIFGTLDPLHLRQNLEIIEHPYLTMDEWRKVLPLPEK